MIHGSLTYVTIDGNRFECETNAEINLNVEMLPASAVDSGRWQEYLAGLRSWEVTVDGRLIANIDGTGTDVATVINAIISGDQIAIVFQVEPTAGSFSLSGNAIPSTTSITAPSDGVSTWNILLSGTGPLTMAI